MKSEKGRYEAGHKEIVNTVVGPVEIRYDGKYWWDNRRVDYPCEELPLHLLNGGYPSRSQMIYHLNRGW